ncbi:xaa-Pro aminopeptidase ApepP-like [Saccostrea echinata]|uniref:xaa-Pro aminopeptidase ApepP-like n=1 Tax=Saccostrea echinata TaxID=191078 RepID=UPI002A81539D|nr:xaa-Pro aminopeptidase ApepP-like [Saccostrea echinata]
MYYVVLFLLFPVLWINSTTGTAEKWYAKDFIPKESYYFNEGDCHTDRAKVKRLNDVRNLMRENHIDAYIICNVNENHGTLTPYDRRIEAISGFTGGIGTAVVTLDKAVLWTDGRTFQTAIDDVDCGWAVYRKGGDDTTSLVDWIFTNIQATTGSVSVGASPYLVSAVWWKNFEKVFAEKKIDFVPVYPDFIDLVWTDDRPPLPSSPIHILPLKFTGETWQSKIKRTMHMMGEKNADVLVLTNLDEIAWLFNIRARDFTFDPYFISFCLINARTSDVSLYIVNHEKKLTQNCELEDLKIHEFLNTSQNGSCAHWKCLSNTNKYGDDSVERCERISEVMSDRGNCVEVKEYSPSVLKDDIRKLSHDERIRKVWVSWESSQSFVMEIPKEKLVMEHSPPLIFKAAKNDGEIQGKKNSTLRESVFLSSYFAGLEERMKNGEVLSVQEIEAETKELRKNVLFNRGPSGTSLIGFGSTALPMVPKITDDVITEKDVLLFDMGAQYLDGTTDIARSFVYGTPSERQKDIYTRLLMTHINLAKKTFPVGSTGRDLDTREMREPLQEIGVDFPHEIGHMVAAYGAIVEGPASISNTSADWKSDVPLDRHIFDCNTCKQPQDLITTPDWRDYTLKEGMVFSNEPSFYGKGEFGMRIENTMLIIKGNCSEPCYAFEQLVFLPYESKLIKPELLTDDQISWLKDYYTMVDKLVTPQLGANNDTNALKWLKERTNLEFLFQ